MGHDDVLDWIVGILVRPPVRLKSASVDGVELKHTPLTEQPFLLRLLSTLAEGYVCAVPDEPPDSRCPGAVPIAWKSLHRPLDVLRLQGLGWLIGIIDHESVGGVFIQELLC